MNGIAKAVLLGVLFCAALSGCGQDVDVKEGAKTQAATDVRYGKELEEIRKSLKGDIKIKLRKDGKGAYSWEIAGKDAQEVLRANSVLSRRINDGKHE